MNIHDFIPQSRIASRLPCGVYVARDRIVATDGVKLLEIKRDTGASFPAIVRLPRAMKDLERVEYGKEGKIEYASGGKKRFAVSHIGYGAWFPLYEKIIPAENETVFSIRVSARQLKQVAEAMDDRDGHLDVSFFGKNRVIVFRTVENMKPVEQKMALLMPIGQKE